MRRPTKRLTKAQQDLLTLLDNYGTAWREFLPVASSRSAVGGVTAGINRTLAALEYRGLVRWLHRGEMYDFGIVETGGWVITDEGRKALR